MACSDWVIVCSDWVIFPPGWVRFKTIQNALDIRLRVRHTLLELNRIK